MSVGEEAALAVLLVETFGPGVAVQTTAVVRAAALRLLREEIEKGDRPHSAALRDVLGGER